MSYNKIDPIISKWISEYSLTLCTKYQDTEVRSVEIVSPSGQRYQIWIDRPTDQTVKVHAWDYKKRRIDWDVSIIKLGDCLESALATVFDWINKN